MTDIRIDRPEETKTQTKKYYKSKYCFSLHLPKELEEKVKDAAESEARYILYYKSYLKRLERKEIGKVKKVVEIKLLFFARLLY